MTEKRNQTKNQHYVPCFYLRKFSTDERQRCINLFNQQRNLFKKNVSIRDQASRDYYYGDDGKVESHLSEYESIIGEAFHRTLESEKCPGSWSEDYFNFLVFCNLTDLRSPVREKIYNQMTNSAIQEMLKMNERFKGIANKYEFTRTDSSIYSLRYLLELVELCSDLHLKVLVNSTNHPFITSDYPVARYNQYLEQRTPHTAITGYGFVGLQIFAPISPRLMLFFYDYDVYKVGKSLTNTVHVTRAEDIDQLNILQFVGCLSNTYGNESYKQEYAERLNKCSAKYSKANAVTTVKLPMMNDKTGNFTIHRIDSLRTELMLSFVSFTAAALNYRPSASSINLGQLLRPHARRVRDRLNSEDDGSK